VDELLVEKVLRAVEAIPRGRVASYGDIAALVGCGPRQVGRVMRHHGGNVPWWRVTSASGDLVVLEAARPMWADEGIEVRPSGSGCRMADYRADPGELSRHYAQAVADLPEAPG